MSWPRRVQVYLGFDDIVRCLSHVQYRQPGYTLELYRHPFEGFRNLVLDITFTVPDAYNDGIQQQVVHVPLPPLVSAQHFYDWLRWRLGVIAQHEVSEMLWMDDKPINDPHSDEYWALRLDAFTTIRYTGRHTEAS